MPMYTVAFREDRVVHYLVEADDEEEAVEAAEAIYAENEDAYFQAEEECVGTHVQVWMNDDGTRNPDWKVWPEVW